MDVGFLGEDTDREGQRMYPKKQKEKKKTHTHSTVPKLTEFQVAVA